MSHDDEAISRLDALYPAMARDLRRHPDHPARLARAARALSDADEHRHAASCLARAVSISPDAQELRAGWADTLRASGAIDDAAEVLREGLRQAPDSLHHQRRLGRLLLEDFGRSDDAARLLGAVARRTGGENDYENLAHCFLDEPSSGRIVAALVAVLGDEVKPALALQAVAESLLHARRYEEAAELAAYAARKHGENAAILRTSGWAATLLGDAAAAAPYFTRALVLAPPASWATAWSCFCNLQMRGDYDAARGVLQQLVRRGPGYPGPAWDGGPVEGKTIRFHQEHFGFGDVIQFVRFAAWLKERGAYVRVVAKHRMRPWLRLVDGVDDVVTEHEPAGSTDYECGTGWPWALFGIPMTALAARVPYIRPDPQRVAAWRRRLRADGRLTIGLAWEGSDARQKYPRSYGGRRSIPLPSLAPLLDLPDVQVYSVQHGTMSHPDWRSHPPQGLSDLPAREGDLADLAALVGALDAIVTVDTAIAHLAGAIGRPTWILLPHAADWRWELGRLDSPWYPSVRLVRQGEAGVWKTAIDDACRQVAAFVAAARGDRAEATVDRRPQGPAAVASD